MASLDSPSSLPSQCVCVRLCVCACVNIQVQYMYTYAHTHPHMCIHTHTWSCGYVTSLVSPSSLPSQWNATCAPWPKHTYLVYFLFFMHIHEPAYKYMNIFGCRHRYIYIYTNTHTHTYSISMTCHVRAIAYAYILLSLHIFDCLHIYMNIPVCRYRYIYAHIHTHTYSLPVECHFARHFLHKCMCIFV